MIEWLGALDLVGMGKIVVGIVAGSGGLMYWWDRWRSRPQIRSRIISTGRDHIVVEVENTSTHPNSLQPYILVSGLGLMYDRVVRRCEVREADRSLPPFEQKRFTLHQRGSRRVSDDVLFLRYPVIHVAGTRGRAHFLRFKSLAEATLLSRWRYWTQRTIAWVRGRRIVERGYRGFQALAQEYEDRQGPELQAECPRCGTIQGVDVSFAEVAGDPAGSVALRCAACKAQTNVQFSELLTVDEEEDDGASP